MPDSKVEVDVVINDSKVSSGLDAANSKVEKGASKIGATAGNIAKTVGKVLATASVAAAAAAGAFAVKGIGIASDLNEVQNVVDVAFGSMSADVDKWANTATNAYGLSTLAAKQYTGTMGAMLKSMGVTGKPMEDMSTKLAGLAGDFASFYNISSDDAWEKIRAGISGEVIPLKEIGINMDQASLDAFAMKEGLKQSYAQMSQADQALLRYNYLMSVSTDAQGDFARTSNSWANQLRTAKLNIDTLSASVGKQLIPALGGVLEAFNQAVQDSNGDFGAFIDNFGKVVEAGEEAAKQIMPVITSLASEVLGALIKILPQLLDMGGDIIINLVDGIINALPKITGALGKLANKILSILPQLLGNLLSKLPVIIDSFTSSLLGVESPLATVDAQIQDLQDKSDSLKNSVDDMEKTLKDETESINANAEAAQKLTDKLFSQTNAERLSTNGKAEAKELISQLNKIYPDLNLSIDENTGAINKNKEAVDAQINSLKNQALVTAYASSYADALKKQNDAYKANQDAIKAYDAELDSLTNGTSGYCVAEGITIDQLKQAAKDNPWGWLGRLLKSYTDQIDSTGESYNRASKDADYWLSKQNEILKTLSTATGNMTDPVKQYLGELTNYNQQIENNQQKHEDKMGSIYDYGLKKQKISLSQVAKNLRKQVSDAQSYAKNMAILKAEVASGKISQDVYDQIDAEGTNAAGVVADLVKKPKNKKEAKTQKNAINAFQGKADYAHSLGEGEAGAQPLPSNIAPYIHNGPAPAAQSSLPSAISSLSSAVTSLSSIVAKVVAPTIPKQNVDVNVNIEDFVKKHLPPLKVYNYNNNTVDINGATISTDNSTSETTVALAGGAD